MALGGCGGRESNTFNAAGNMMSDDEPAASSAAKAAADEVAAPASPAGAGISGYTPQRSASGVERKIIYNADVSLIVDNLSPAQRKLLILVRQYKGYIAESSIGGESGEPRSATWKIRVPVNGYQNFLDAVTKIGEVQTVSSNSQDVSEEYYDIDARLRNKRVEEKRLLDHLNRSTAKLTDILLIEREISRVRGEIEQMQGRLRVLANLTSLTTISVTIHEIKNYVPPKPPTFGTEITRTFESSLNGLINFGKGIVLIIIGAAPWLIVILIIALPLWKWAKRRYPLKQDKS
jgi:hypothetical protein